MKTLELTYRGVIYSKKNSKRIIINRRTGKPQIVSSKQAKDMEKDMMKQLAVQALRQGWKKRIDGDGSTYHVKIAITEKDRTRRDLDNQATSILDALVGAQVLPDDSVKYVKKLHVDCVGVDKENPRAEITIEEIN